MIKKIAWNTFKQTGDIETYLELKQFERAANKDVFGDGEKNHISFENDALSRMEPKGMSLNDAFLKGQNQEIFQTNIEKAVNNFWDNVNKG